LTDAAKLRELRATEGHPAREAMIKYNRSEKARESSRKYREKAKLDAELHEHILGLRRKGTKSYATRQTARLESRKIAEKARQEWTTEDIINLRIMREQGKTAPEMAVALKRSLQGVERKLQKLGMTKKEVK